MGGVPSATLSAKKGVSLGHSVITDLTQVFLTNLTNKVQVKVMEEITPSILSALPVTNDSTTTNILCEKIQERIILKEHQECFAESSKDLGNTKS